MPKGGRSPSDEPLEATGEAPTVTHCTTCGARIDPTVWHPVATDFDDDGEFHLYAFCSIECRDRWKREPSDTPSRK
ncbi:DUF7576 family protein [Halosimplex halophilum]